MTSRAEFDFFPMFPLENIPWKFCSLSWTTTVDCDLDEEAEICALFFGYQCKVKIANPLRHQACAYFESNFGKKTQTCLLSQRLGGQMQLCTSWFNVNFNGCV
ncbi:hypothetical protein T11_8687 [Trichinella zimbabwensis]|uniref:Uncharacterized protein n=1 Tax=Trichinella zimbabwensis TaxID=268475 RepID=A0A0V1HJ49_9BILA|nr:hypothetical protein T11_8687 [Trichinella zimbabwensis]